MLTFKTYLKEAWSKQLSTSTIKSNGKNLQISQNAQFKPDVGYYCMYVDLGGGVPKWIPPKIDAVHTVNLFSTYTKQGNQLGNWLIDKNVQMTGVTPYILSINHATLNKQSVDSVITARIFKHLPDVPVKLERVYLLIDSSMLDNRPNDARFSELRSYLKPLGFTGQWEESAEPMLKYIQKTAEIRKVYKDAEKETGWDLSSL